jgi:hypothetical protein
MSRWLCFVLAATLVASAQQPQTSLPPTARTNMAERQQAPTYSDVYCAGFISKKSIPAKNFVVAGLETANSSQFAKGDVMFVEGGGLQEGALISLVRELHDPNENEGYRGQHAAVRATGQPYADLGWARIVAVRGSAAVARIEFSCAPVVARDVAVPFEERAIMDSRKNVPFDRFPRASSSLTGQVVLAKDFDTVLGIGQKVYLNLGSDKGVKTGDYFNILRSYDPAEMEEIDSLSYRAHASEDTQNSKRKIKSENYAALPMRAVGQAVVLMSNPGSSTAMITFALEDVLVGDQVEMLPVTSASAH